MRQTCDFERFTPPALTERDLRRELEKSELSLAAGGPNRV